MGPARGAQGTQGSRASVGPPAVEHRVKVKNPKAPAVTRELGVYS
jgi:hypothetical protein